MGAFLGAFCSYLRYLVRLVSWKGHVQQYSSNVVAHGCDSRFSSYWFPVFSCVMLMALDTHAAPCQMANEIVIGLLLLIVRAITSRHSRARYVEVCMYLAPMYLILASTKMNQRPSPPPVGGLG